MSVSASRIVSIRSLVISVLSWSSVRAGSMPGGTLHGQGSRDARTRMQHSKFPAEMRAKPITEHLWRMCRWGVANAYLVRETDGSLTLVDTMFRGCGAVIRAASAPLGEVARI